MNATAPMMPLGIEGFTYADLHAPARLKDLYEVFCRRVSAFSSCARRPCFCSSHEE